MPACFRFGEGPVAWSLCLWCDEPKEKGSAVGDPAHRAVIEVTGKACLQFCAIFFATSSDRI